MGIEDYFEKRMYVYRNSYKFYSKISIALLIVKLMFSASGLSAFFYVELALLSLGSGIIEILEKSIKQNERLSEYKMCYKFYVQSANLFKANKITEVEFYLKEEEFIENMEFFPREKYLKETQLNGYSFV